ncbi:MAG TPA: hypothetical protein VE476_15065 [Propionibacteriaceae bacterium]|nr:hypothetical protein [Propionibacteriaceae bacterium]
MRTAAKIIVAGVSTVALAGGIGAGLAYADPTDPTPTPTPTASASPTEKADPRVDVRKRRGLLATALHGEVTLAGKQHRVVVFQRGPAQKVDGSTLTVRSADGYTATYVIGTETKVRKNREAATAADLQADDRIHVIAVEDGSTLKALRVRAID